MSLSLIKNIKTGSINEHLLELDQLINGKQTFILCDENTCVFLDYLFKNVPSLTTAKKIKIPSGENYKNLNTSILIWEFLSKNKAKRNSVLINFGGGMITDIGGFTAATFKRGISYINIPTSLLAMIDASFGGKTGINLNHEKNQIGVFSNPDLVICDPFFLKTQSKDQISSGYAEIIKHGLIYDNEYWKYCTSNTINNLDFNKIITDSIKIKAKVVSEDPTENGRRKILNFGHTIGHAIETLMINRKKPVLHGQAIAAGLYTEAFISNKIAKLTELELKEIQHYIYSNYNKISFNRDDLNEILKIMENDKKRYNKKHNFSLITKIGNATFDNFVEDNIVEAALIDYMEYS